MKRIILFTFYFLLFIFYSKAQVNLVPNPSFEQLDSCPTSINQIMYASPWFQPFTDLSGNPNSSTDLFSTCCSNNSCSVPINFAGTQQPKSGNSYVGLNLYFTPSSVYREYIENILNDTLSNGKTYCIDFYISLGDNSKWAISNIGAYFSTDSCLQVIPPSIELPYTPQVENSDTLIVKDKVNWQRISLPYQALGGERFMTIGNFNNNNNTDTMFVGGTTTSAYYYIDDVSVIDISTPAYAGVDTTITIGDSIFIGRTPEIGLNDDCIWYVNGSPIDTVGGLWVMPDSTTTYILEQTICGYTTYDTVTVTVLPTHINELFNENSVRIYPNPTTGETTLEMIGSESNEWLMAVLDVQGRTVIEKLFNGNKIKLKLALDSGVYLVRITNNNTNETVIKKLIINR